MRGNAVVVILVLAVGGILPGTAGAAPSSRSVGVVDFYAPTPLGTFSGLVPERFAADEFSKMLSGAAAGRFTVIPRSAMGQAEAAVGWRDGDVLHFDRLEHLEEWLASEIRKDLVRKVQHLLEDGDQVEIKTGLEFWFTPPASEQRRAKRYKQFLITLSAIFPLTVLVPWALAPLFRVAPAFGCDGRRTMPCKQAMIARAV